MFVGPALAAWTNRLLEGLINTGWADTSGGAGALCTEHVNLNGTSTSAGVIQIGALLTIDCEINPPTPGIEGITLEIPGLLDFDTTEFSDGGLTVFVSRNR